MSNAVREGSTRSMVLFKERQPFRHTAISRIVAGLCFTLFAVLVYGLIQIATVGGAHPLDDPHTQSIVILIGVFILLGLGIPLVLFRTGLRTEVRIDGLYVKVFPHHMTWKHVPLVELESVEEQILSTSEELLLGGIAAAKPDNVFRGAGKTLLELSFSNGEKLLITTNRPSLLTNALEQSKQYA